MKWKISNQKTRLYVIAAVILIVGLASAGLIYLTAEENHDRVLGYEMAGGYVYPIAPEDSKTYAHDLELFGGKANVLADGLRRWIAGLWHGKSLALTVAFMTILLSFGFFIAARHLRSGLESDGLSENTGDRSC